MEPCLVRPGNVIKMCISDLLAELKSCSITRDVQRGRTAHEAALHSRDVRVANALIHMYAKCGCLAEARNVFKSLNERTVVSWNTIITGCAENGEGGTALELFTRVEAEGHELGAITFVAALKACIDLAEKEQEDPRLVKVASKTRGEAIHFLASRNGCDSHIYVKGTLVHMYAKCGCMGDARRIFDSIEEPNQVLWNVLISGYAENGECSKALELFRRMKREGGVPDQITYVACLRACGTLGALDLGKNIHAEIHERQFKHDVILANCLVDFYAKCGSLDEAEHVFDLQPARTIVTWTSLITGYSRHGDTESVFRIFDRLLDSGVQPNAVTFLCVLSACSHTGLTNKGKDYFYQMVNKYEILPDVDHYTCMVDMLGRGKYLDEAMIMLRSMPYTPNASSWLAILAACRKWKNLELARMAFESLEDKNSGAYVLMSNIYASKGMWAERDMMQDLRSKLGVWKVPGQSWWTDPSGEVSTFSSGDKGHRQNVEIQEKLKELGVGMRELGYVADISTVTRNLTSDVEKEDALCSHSERLAIACALINTKPRETIRIMKNLRACEDCHVATGFISRIEERTIICRDANRFHVFKDGKCSCGDFW